MTESFGKPLILFIFHFLIICSNTYAWSCTSQEAHHVAYVKHVAIDLARNFHLAFNMEEADYLCLVLMGIVTTLDQEEMMCYNSNEQVQQIVTDINVTAETMIQTFSGDTYSNINLSLETLLNIYDSANAAINRLLRTRRFEYDSSLIQTIRNLRQIHCGQHQRQGLIIDGVPQIEAPSTPEMLFNSSANLVQFTIDFKALKTKTVESPNLLYVSQAEMAVTRIGDGNVGVLGSGEVSTSIIVVLHMAGTGVYGVAQIDENENTLQGFSQLVASVLTLANSYTKLEMYLVGGISDPNGIGEDIFFSIMEATHKQDYSIHLIFACIDRLNTENFRIGDSRLRYPVISGVAINLWDSRNPIVPATFIDTGPDMKLRAIRLLYVRNTFFDVYDYLSGRFIVDAFYYPQVSRRPSKMLRMSSEAFRERFGNPFGYDPKLVKMRDTLRFLAEYPSSEAAFPGNRPRIYVRNREDGSWVPPQP